MYVLFEASLLTTGSCVIRLDKIKLSEAEVQIKL